MRDFKFIIGRTTAGLLAAIFCFTPANAQSVFSQATYAGSFLAAGPHALVALHATINSGSGGYILAFNSASLPSAGALATPPAGCFYIQPAISPATGSTLGMSNTANPVPVITGLVVVLSSTGCDTYTPTTGYLSVTYQ